jgi:hypothetical protein
MAEGSGASAGYAGGGKPVGVRPARSLRHDFILAAEVAPIGGSVSEYHKIETLYERDEKTHRLKPELTLKNPVYGCLKTWHWTEKIDGTNMRCIWYPAFGMDSIETVRTKETLTFGGKTDNAQIPSDLVKWLYENVTADKMRAVFPETPVVIYAEGYGAGIQKGGGDYSPVKKIIVFDVFVIDPVNSRLGGWWLNWENTCDVATTLGLDVVPYLGEMTLKEATEKVRAGFKSKAAVVTSKDAEGMVGRPLEALFDKKGHRLIVKLKTKDF